MSSARSATVVLSPGRIDALTDGVFAIIMTLLVLELGIPVITGSHTGSELPRRLFEMWPKFLSFFVTFVMLGFMWSIHQYWSRYIKRSDGVFIWINIIFLMFLCVLPFSTALLGHYITEQTAIGIYGANFIACMIVRYIMWCYIIGNHRLADDDIPPPVIKNSKRMIIIGICTYIFGIGFSFINTWASIAMFAFIMIFFIIRSTLLNRIRLPERA